METSPLYPSLKFFIETEWERISREQIEPWFFMTAGPPFRCKNFYGQEIRYQGIAFEGTPREVFWGNYIEPFLKDLIERSVNSTTEISIKKGVELPQPLQETSELLKRVIQNAYSYMAKVDQSLLGRGNPNLIPQRDTAPLTDALETFVDERIAGELKAWKPKSWFTKQYEQHPFWFWLIGIVVTLVIAVGQSL